MKKILVAILILVCCAVYVDFVRFPECYVTTWKNQLEMDINAGDEEAIEYYNSRYIENDRELFN